MKAHWNRDDEYWTIRRGKLSILATITLYWGRKTRALNGLYRVRLHRPKPHIMRYPDGTVRMFQLLADAKRATEEMVIKRAAEAVVGTEVKHL